MSDEDKPPPWAQALGAQMTTGFSAVEKRLDAIEANVDLQKGSVQDLMQRMARVEDRQNTSSMRVKAESDVNLKQDSAIAEILVKVDEIATKTDAQTQILTRLESGAKALIRHPRVQVAAGIVWTALLMYAASKGWVSK